MRGIVALIAGILISTSPHPAAAQQDCVDQTPCALDDRSYHVKVPDDWDGVTPMPVMLHFHGWGRQGTLIVKHGRISGATRKRGVLLLAPNGLGKSWDFWNPGSPDTDFAAAVIDLDQRESCDTMPAEVRHTHGLRDTVLDYP